MEMYLADLRKWPLEVALTALERWPEQSQWWPTWNDLLLLLGELQADRVAMLPKPRLPEHRLLRNGDDVADREPFRSRLEWDQFALAMMDLRDARRPMLARQALLQIGEKIEARQLPNAQQRGWAS